MFEYVIFSAIHSRDWPKSQSFPAESCNQIQNCILYYKGLYLVTKDFNRAFGQVCIPIIKFFVMMGLVLSFFALVCLHNELGISSLITVVLALSTTLFLIVPASIIMSNLFEISSKFYPRLSPKIQLIGDPKAKGILERQLKSYCPIIRCQIGNFYYMEAQAKLTVVHNILDGVMFLVVNTKWVIYLKCYIYD